MSKKVILIREGNLHFCRSPSRRVFRLHPCWSVITIAPVRASKNDTISPLRRQGDMGPWACTSTTHVASRGCRFLETYLSASHSQWLLEPSHAVALLLVGEGRCDPTGCFDVSRAWPLVGDFVFILPLNSHFYQLRQRWSFHKTHLPHLCGPTQTVLRHVDLVMLAMGIWLREQEVARHGNMYTYLFLVGAGSQKKPKTLKNWVWRLLLMRNFFII